MFPPGLDIKRILHGESTKNINGTGDILTAWLTNPEDAKISNRSYSVASCLIAGGYAYYQIYPSQINGIINHMLNK